MFGSKKQQQAEAPPAVRYDYRVVEVFWRFRGAAHHAGRKIEQMEGKGWEYVDQIPGPVNSVKLTFRRPK